VAAAAGSSSSRRTERAADEAAVSVWDFKRRTTMKIKTNVKAGDDWEARV
jgi:hypothetical protein